MKQPTKEALRYDLHLAKVVADALQKQCINLVSDKEKLERNYHYYKESCSAWYRAYREQFDQNDWLKKFIDLNSSPEANKERLIDSLAAERRVSQSLNREVIELNQQLAAERAMIATLQRKAGDEAIKHNRTLKELNAGMEKVKEYGDGFYKKYFDERTKTLRQGERYFRACFVAVLEAATIVLLVIKVLHP
jgi:hypothetical protein